MSDTSNNTRRAPLSRRARPAKAPLSCEVIADAALEVLVTQGSTGLSLRKVAAALDTGPASLYVYFDNLQALYQAMLDRAYGEIEMPTEPDLDWRERLFLLISRFVSCLQRRPGLAQLGLTVMPTGPNMMRLSENIISLLEEGGIEGGRAVLALDALLLHFTADVAEKDLWNSAGLADPPENMEAAVRLVSPEQFPHLSANIKHFFTGDFDARFRWTFDMMINGIQHTAY